MAALKYKDSNGNYQPIVGLKVENVNGFNVTQDDTNGIDVFTALGGATITEDNTNGIDNFNF
jgi:hypothetical protein